MKMNTEKKRIRLIALDLDGTTLNSRKEITPRTMKAFRAAMERGVHVVISTGRTFDALPTQLFSMEGLEYVITSNGAHITALASREQIYENPLKPSCVEALVNLLRTRDPAGGVEVETFCGGRAYIDAAVFGAVKERGSDYRDAQYILTTRNPVPDICGFMLEHRSDIENISLNFRDLRKKADWQTMLNAIPDIKVTSSFTHNLEIGDAGTSKGNALRVLMERLGLTPEEMMACGDSPNDGEMLDLAGISVAVDNAAAEIKAMADVVTDTNNNDGVAKAIEQWVL